VYYALRVCVQWLLSSSNEVARCLCCGARGVKAQCGRDVHNKCSGMLRQPYCALAVDVGPHTEGCAASNTPTYITAKCICRICTLCLPFMLVGRVSQVHGFVDLLFTPPLPSGSILYTMQYLKHLAGKCYSFPFYFGIAKLQQQSLKCSLHCRFHYCFQCKACRRYRARAHA
jgi:hypothetical protein